MHPLSPGTTTEGALAAYKGECLHGVIVLFNRTMKFARAALLASGGLACSGLRDLNSPNDGRAARGRTRVSVREHDWDCRDCTATEPPARFEVSWEEFLPYLFAYLWPVQTPEGPVDLFVCSGTNGVADLPALEPLRQEGFLVAAAFAQHEPIAVELERIRARHNAGQTRSADGLAQEVHAFVRSVAGQSHACGAAEGVEWFTGVVVRECVGPKL